MTNSIAVFGTGNVAFHLAQNLHKANHDVTIISRSIKAAREFREDLGIPIKTISPLDLEDTYDFTFLAVPDGVIEKIATQTHFCKSIVIHLSGSVGIEVLEKNKKYGVMYPLQTLTKGKPVNFSTIPLLIEGANAEITGQIHKLAKTINHHITKATSAERLKIHLAAVIACNFTNNLYLIASKLLQDTSLQLKDFSHLLNETLEKSLEITPRLAQTGPAKRGDREIMDKHVNILDDDLIKQLYRLHSKVIQELH